MHSLSSALLVLCVCHLALALPAGFQLDPNNPVVQTKYGPVRGTLYKPSHTLYNRPFQIVQFVGVPYASPPTGTNRFRAPKFPVEWTYELQCDESRRVLCPQTNSRFTASTPTNLAESEDCLHLNIYVPTQTRFPSLPVLVYFHGGEFKYGGKDLFRPDYLLESSMNNQNAQGMIVITVNYRLGILGFLSTDDVNAPGNNGVRDQVLALQWINENIAKFNGNPQNVTIMGQDAGGVSVSFHVLNPESWKYFHSAISISGSVFSPWAIEDNPVNQARDFGYKFFCDGRPDRIVECLRYQDLSSLISTSAEKDWSKNNEPFWFKPVVDRNVTGSALLRDFPANLYKAGQYARVPYVLVSMAQDGSLDYYLNRDRIKAYSILEQKIGYLINPFLKAYTSKDIMASAFSYRYFNRTQRSTYNTPGNLNNIGASLSNNYNQAGNTGFRPNNPSFLNNPISVSSVSGYSEQEADKIFVDLLTDFLYLGPMDFIARHHSTSADVIMLIFGYLGQTKSFGPLQREAPTTSRDTYGVTHGHDVFFSFVTDYDNRALGVNEISIAKTYSNFVSEFVLYGTANQRFYRYTSSSPNYNLLNSFYQTINPVAAAGGEGYRTQYVDFINNYIYQLQDQSAFFPPYFPTDKYKAYESATWSLVGVIILLLIILAVIGLVLYLRNRNKNQEDQQRNKRNENVTLRKQRGDSYSE